MKSVKLLAVAVIAVAAIVVCASVVLMPSNKDSEERIGVIGAMDVEVKTLKEAMTIDYTRMIAGMELSASRKSSNSRRKRSSSISPVPSSVPWCRTTA